jgi:DNA-binding NtrC family response regulator
VDVRIIAATNRDLSSAVQEGTFREDLYWRLKVISIDLPPLRRRTEDIPELVEYFISRFSAEHNKAIPYVPERVMNRLKSYSWPGNIRELENCLNRAVILCAGDIIAEEHIEFLDRQKEYDAHATNRNQIISSLKEKIENIMPEVMQLFTEGIHANIIETVEEVIIMKALEKSGNNQVKAAEMLESAEIPCVTGLKSTVNRKMRQYQATACL